MAWEICLTKPCRYVSRKYIPEYDFLPTLTVLKPSEVHNEHELQPVITHCSWCLATETERVGEARMTDAQLLLSRERMHDEERMSVLNNMPIRKYYQANRKKYREYGNRYRQTHLEKCLEYERRSRQRHPDRNKIFSARHPDKIKEYQKRYYVGNVEKCKERVAIWAKNNVQSRQESGRKKAQHAVYFKNKLVYVNKPPRTGKCSRCNEKRRTNMFHHQWGEDPLQYTEELCNPCMTKTMRELGRL